MILYSVHGWDAHYENSESRKIKHCRYVLVPNKHDGRGYGRMMAHPEGERLFAAWNALVQVASKMPQRGVLKDQDGVLTASDLAFKTRLRVETFEMALAFFSDPSIGWLSQEVVNPDEKSQSPGIPGQSPGIPGESPGLPPIEGNRREGNNTGGEPPAPPGPPAKPKTPKAGENIPPSIEEVTAYCREKRNGVDPVKWWNFYNSKGWLVGKVKMKNWISAVATWARDASPPSGNSPAYGVSSSRSYDPMNP